VALDSPSIDGVNQLLMQTERAFFREGGCRDGVGSSTRSMHPTRTQVMG
jgi:hypothetical protein